MMDGFVDYVSINKQARGTLSVYLWDARNLPLKRLINVFAFLIYVYGTQLYVGHIILLIPPP